MVDQFEPFQQLPRRRTGTRGEGIVTGLLGAAVVALYYLLIDFVRGQPLMTPSVLGDAFHPSAPDRALYTRRTSPPWLRTPSCTSPRS